MLSIWEPFGNVAGEFGRLQRDAERNWGLRSGRSQFAPSVDIFEDKEALVVRAEIPGVKREEVDISVDGNILTLKGERALEKEEDGRRFHRVERNYGVFVRHFQLPTTVDADKIEAKLVDGVLTVRIPKKSLAKARKIDVSAAD